MRFITDASLSPCSNQIWKPIKASLSLSLEEEEEEDEEDDEKKPYIRPFINISNKQTN